MFFVYTILYLHKGSHKKCHNRTNFHRTRITNYSLRPCCKQVPPKEHNIEFYVYGSVHRWSILIIVQRDATQSSVFLILQVHSTCFGCQQHPSSGVHKTVTTASGTMQLSPSNMAKGSCTKKITITGDCSYNFVYSWWWLWLTPETCRMNLQNNK